MHTTSIDGVPAFVADGPAPVAAGLVFGVGRQDETFVRSGITHLVEHLVMGGVGRRAIEVNASVDLTTTEFTCTGPADQVAAFLRDVCTQLADPPVDRLQVEADVLRAEGGTVASPPVAHLLGELYGADGPGLAAVPEPALLALTVSDVRTWSARWFHRRNAAVWWSGPVPADASLPLPGGEVPPRPAAVPRALDTPAWTGSPFPERVTLAARTGVRSGVGACLAVLRSRVEDELRHRRGVSYAVQTEQVPVGPDEDVVVLSTDVRPGHEAVAAHVLWEQLVALALHGPRPEELDHERAVLEAVLDDPRSAVEEARSHARDRVTGTTPVTRSELRARATALTPEAVRVVAAALRDAALLALPEPLAAGPAGLPRWPEWSQEVVLGREFRPTRRSGAPPAARLVVGEEGVSLFLDSAERVTVRWADVVGLVRVDPDTSRVHGRDGFALPVVASDWRDGAEAEALVRAAVPAELHVLADDARDGAVLLVKAPVHRVEEAIGVTRWEATLVGDERWTALVPDEAHPSWEWAQRLAGVSGQRTVALAVRQGRVDADYVLYERGVEVDRHRWGTVHGDAGRLARLTGADPAAVAGALFRSGGPDEVVDHLATVLDLPEDAVRLLRGEAVQEPRRVAGRGVVGGMRAAVRGDFAPPPGSGTWTDRYAALGRARPWWYRLLNALAAVALGVVAVRALTAWDGLGGWSVVVAVVVGLLAVCSAVEVRPPRRPAPGSPGG
ncbi:insulinase family protein [Modestobacter roseus]|uniref:Putative Zn-dependent peptidase n=1 Tax=Modestobacter roseus TaxID=1181884 RepID=A0A562ITF8_9ACTN|nr:insulinase family protein [Modestobacter roseus]MQA33856.1 hypothetical protein [Modestobacter roseus]TWH73975.1 putative Zn-dependent peptidase [Modestobacter roseus]